jgi:squalene-hopene/tetraprenyl-beta-curcumene cyclase
MRSRLILAVLAGHALLLSSWGHAAPATPPAAAGEQAADDRPKYDPDEPLAQTFSLEKSADYLDAIAAFWLKKSEVVSQGGHPQRRHSCGACHANFAYMMARPLLLEEKPVSLLAETRRCMEQHVAALDPATKDESGYCNATSAYHFRGAGPTLAIGLVFHDLHSGRELRPTTRKAFDKMWALRRPLQNRQDDHDGRGPWYQSGFCWDLSAPELDGDYNSILAALAVGTAADGDARGGAATEEIAHLREYLGRRFDNERRDLASDLHAQALALWASRHFDGLLSPTKREAIVRSLLAVQRSDGGWSLSDLGGKWHGGRQQKVSDGYATGLVVHALRRSGLPADRPEIARGVAWLKQHQRASGGWFTPQADRNRTEGGIGTHDLAILNLGTAYAVMAVHACENTAEAN